MIVGLHTNQLLGEIFYIWLQEYVGCLAMCQFIVDKMN